MSQNPGSTNAPSSPNATSMNQFGGTTMPNGRALKAAAR